MPTPRAFDTEELATLETMVTILEVFAHPRRLGGCQLDVVPLVSIAQWGLRSPVTMALLGHVCVGADNLSVLSSCSETRHRHDCTPAASLRVCTTVPQGTLFLPTVACLKANQGLVGTTK